MQSQYGAGEQPTKKRQMEEEDDELRAVRRQMFDHSTIRDNARAHLGNSYYSFHAPVHQVAASIATLENDARNVNLRDALRFEEMDSRRATIKLAHGNTCQWFFDSPEYRKWCDNSFLPEHHGFLWLRGKPGAGKSTLMKHAVRHADIEFSDCLRISFFFDAKGAELERSIQGMYRSLLHQLLTQSPVLEKLFDERTWNHKTWPIGTLQELFHDAVLRLGEAKLICYIDALDECDISEIRDMIDFLEDVASKAVSANVQFRVFFASRHYPNIRILRCVHIILDNLKGHQRDIETYVENTLKIPTNELRHESMQAVRKKAGDVFLWVVLVMRRLNQESDLGDPGRLSDRLRGIPPGLHALFENALLERGTGDTTYLVPILLWVLYGKFAMIPLELYCVILHAGNSGSTETYGPTPSFDQVERFILNKSKGLVEVTGAGTLRQVQFIHETVREYLSSGGIGRLDPTLCHNPAGLGHETLRAMCFKYTSHIAQSLPTFKYSAGTDPTYEAFEARRYQMDREFPFFIKAHENSIRQAELAQFHSVSQNPFLEAFPLELVKKGHDLLADPVFHYTASASKVFIFADLGTPQLLELELSNHHGNANHASGTDSLKRGTTDVETSSPSDQREMVNPLPGRSLAQRGLYEAAFGTWRRCECEGRQNPYGASRSSPKWQAGDSQTTLEHGAEVNARAGYYYTALHATVLYEQSYIMRLLVENGADLEAREIDLEETHGPTALCEAARIGSVELVKLLVELGADVNARWEEGTVLQTARKHHTDYPTDGRTEIVAFLIEQGAREDDV